jgi:hypothetical protein
MSYMGATVVALRPEIDRATRTKAYLEAERKLDFVAVCLIGSRHPLPLEIGSNRTITPVEVVFSRKPEDAPKLKDRAWYNGQCELLDHCWTESEAHAKRLKDAIITRILGDDPDMVRLRHTWLDLPNYEISWGFLVKDALMDLKSRRETISIFSNEQRIHLTLQAARSNI